MKEELCKNLWNECKDELTDMCKYKLSSHPDEVEDVIADAFYFLCVAVFEERRIENHRAWLIAVTNNLIKKKYTELNKMKLKKRLDNMFVAIERDENIRGKEQVLTATPRTKSSKVMSMNKIISFKG